MREFVQQYLRELDDLSRPRDNGQIKKNYTDVTLDQTLNTFFQVNAGADQGFIKQELENLKLFYPSDLVDSELQKRGIQ